MSPNIASEFKNKIWGKTRLCYLDYISEVHYLIINPRSFCSTHIHTNKHNRFVVLKGCLKVVTGEGNEEVHTILGPDHTIDISPGVYHRFETLDEGCECLEIYWINPLDGDDIVRKQQGGIKNTLGEVIKYAEEK